MQDTLFRAITSRAPLTSASALVRGDACGTAEERLDIYRNMYLWRLVEALGEDFPKLQALAGDEAFAGLCRRYLAAHPSRHPSINYVGAHLVGFLRSDVLTKQRADVVDLARLEWARCEMFEAQGAPVVGTDALVELGARLPDARLVLTPALVLLRLDHLITPLWRALEDDQPPPPIVAQPEAVAVFRRDYDVYHAQLEPDAAAALMTAQKGSSFGTVCEVFGGTTDPVQATLAVVGRWFADGWVSGIEA